MAQVQYFLNPNVNENFNYKTNFFNPELSIVIKDYFKTYFKNKNVPVIKTINFSLNSNSTCQDKDMKFYSVRTENCR